MIAIVKATGATIANGALQLVYQNVQGILTDVFAASFQIWNADLSTQIFPSTPGLKTSLAVTGADRVGVGRWNATWVSAAQAETAATLFNIRWFLTPVSGDAEVSFDQEFEMSLAPYRGPFYCFVSDLRAEGLDVSVTDAQAQARIVFASRYVEWLTGRTFAPTYRVLEVDGTGGRALLLNEPIVAIEKVVGSYASVFTSTTDVIALSSLKVFNRHLRQKLVDPDDRDAPKLEFLHGDDQWGRVETRSVFADHVLWSTGVRNVQLTGIFGYTEGDTSYTGHTPDMIRQATKMLVFDNLRSLASGGFVVTGPITKERTRDQEVNYAALRSTSITGNRAIDMILVGFRRLPHMGAA